MKTINVSLKQNPYKIIIGQNCLAQLGEKLWSLKIGRDAIIITSAPIKNLYESKLTASLKKSGFSAKTFIVPDGEKAKSSAAAIRLMEQIAKYDVYKKPFIVALGGGVIGDLAGFVAAVYKRGIPYVQVPTTLLAQIDSAIGGKVAIDLPVGKNYVGSFYQPKLVLSDVKLLSTLSDRQIRNGLAEAVKYGIIKDKNLFRYLELNQKKILNRHLPSLQVIVEACSRIKTNVVKTDEKETKGIRTILNFGHTIGHAIEAAGGYSVYQHGEAVALGMKVAANISLLLEMTNREDVHRINRLISGFGLPKTIKKIRLKNILSLMKHDKKFISGKNRFVLMQTIGRVKVIEGVSPVVIERAVKDCF